MTHTELADRPVKGVTTTVQGRRIFAATVTELAWQACELVYADWEGLSYGNQHSLQTSMYYFMIRNHNSEPYAD